MRTALVAVACSTTLWLAVAADLDPAPVATQPAAEAVTPDACLAAGTAAAPAADALPQTCR